MFSLLNIAVSAAMFIGVISLILTIQNPSMDHLIAVCERVYPVIAIRTLHPQLMSSYQLFRILFVIFFVMDSASITVRFGLLGFASHV